MKKVVFCFLLMMISTSVFAQNSTLKSEIIDDFISKKREFNKKFGYGYRIQLYNGYEVEAKKIRSKFRYEFPTIKTYLVYEQPEWKIQVGHYKTRLEADRQLLELKKKYKYGIVVPLGK